MSGILIDFDFRNSKITESKANLKMLFKLYDLANKSSSRKIIQKCVKNLSKNLSKKFVKNSVKNSVKKLV